MAQQKIIQYIDDLDGTVVEKQNLRRIHLGYQGKSFELDLSTENAKQLDTLLLPYLAAAGRSGRATKSSAAAQLTPEHREEVREWANAHGYEVSKQGRIANTVLDAYFQAMAAAQ